MKKLPSLLLGALLLFATQAQVKADDLIVAVLEFTRDLDRDALVEGLQKVNLIPLEGKEAADTPVGSGEKAGILYFSRQPLVGGARLASYTGPSGGALEYQISGDRITLKIQVKEGRDVPMLKIVNRNFTGTADLIGNKARVAGIQSSASSKGSSGPGGYKRVSKEFTRVVLVQRVR